MTTKAKYVAGNLKYFDSATKETVRPFSMILVEDDFLGKEFLESEGGSPALWDVIETNLNLSMDVVADTANGVLQTTLDSDSNAELGVLYWGDQKGISLKQGAIFEARINIPVTPTILAEAVWGMSGDSNAVFEDITEYAYFMVDGSTAVVTHSEDTTNTNADKATGVTAGTSDWRIYQIDFTTLTDVKFYIDGVNVSSSTTFDMSNLSDAEAVMQPYIGIGKASGAGVGTVYVDYVRCWSNRS